MAIEAVVFDIGNVLVEWNPERVFDAAVGQAARDHLFHRVGLHAMNEAVDAGAPFAASVAALAAANPDHAATILLWRDRWAEMFSPAIPHSIGLLRALRRAGVPVFALSNFGAETFALAETLYPALTEFDRRYISAHMGVIKPDPSIYAMVEADCGVAPAGLLFTDDRADNIAAAARRGWATHHFEGSAGLARRLVAEGLLSEAEARP
ncbi:MAG: haloacid dehalogenase [Alphaproteobacteria bacterium HGW-Alphaproteobacteria-6]|nr:MAG: haloacid dehalogenase [Alphaproteobacteria bacterium HGW-Alphaproteobacteria-6]